MEEKTMNIEQAAANQAAATAEEYTLNFTGEETDNILQHAEKLRSQTETSDGNMADTVQVYDTDGVPHTISKTELISKAGVNLPSLDQIGGFVAYDKEGNALGLMSTEQVAEVVGELIGIDNIEETIQGISGNSTTTTFRNYVYMNKCIYQLSHLDQSDGIPWYSIGFDRSHRPFISGYYGMIFRAATGRVEMGLNGVMTGPGFVQSSDRRLKSNISKLPPVLEKLKKLQPSSYTLKSDKEHKEHIGLIAQEVEGIFPQFVHTDGKGYKAIDYASMVAICIKAIQELLINY